MDRQTIGSLEDIWPLQAELNARAGFDTRALGEALNEVIDEDGTYEPSDNRPGPNVRLEVGVALKNYIDALAAECHEMRECLSWKHWYSEAKAGRQYELRDLQNARVEAADMLFFWVSICQLLGLEPADVYRLYESKLRINHRRQEEDRSQADHAEHEEENREVV